MCDDHLLIGVPADTTATINKSRVKGIFSHYDMRARIARRAVQRQCRRRNDDDNGGSDNGEDNDIATVHDAAALTAVAGTAPMTMMLIICERVCM